MASFPEANSLSAEAAKRSALDEAYTLLKTNFSVLMDLVQPDDVCDDLFSSHILTDEVMEFVNNEEKPLKAKKRKVLITSLQKIKGNHDRLEAFLKILEKWGIAKDLCVNVRDIMKSSSRAYLHNLQEFKTELSILHKHTLQSDENIEAKYTIMKERITSFFQSRLEDSIPKPQLSELLHNLCYEEMVIPVALHKWSFFMLEEITRIANTSAATDKVSMPLQADKKLFSESIAHNCLILCCLVALDDYKKFLNDSGHDFDELSVSCEAGDSELERYVIAKREKDKELYIAFRGEADLQAWQKTGIISEGISKQADRLPVRFFVEQIKDGYSIIFTGYTFGGLLALSVYTSVWNQTCLSINNLSQNTLCVTFGVPVVPLRRVEETIECIPEMRENSHIFQLKGDLVSRLLRFDDISSSNGIQSQDKFPGKVGAIIVNHLQNYMKAVEKDKNIEGPLSDLKSILSDEHLTKLREVKLYGAYHYIHSQMVSRLASQSAADTLKIPSPAELDNVPKNSNIIKEHSLWKYYDILKKSFVKPNGIKKPPLVIKELSLLKPDVKSITFYRHGDEISLELQGQSLWFCSKISIKSKSGSRFIDTLEANGTNRSVHFNYTPKNENDLLIERKSTTVDIVLYSHFWEAIPKRKLQAKCLGEYHVSYRQRQLAMCTPGQVLTLSFLSALLECTSDGLVSKRFTAICQFLEQASRIVPIESIFYAIANAPQEIAWKCTEAFMHTDVTLAPSLQLAAGLEAACACLAYGSDSTLLRGHMQRQFLHFINQMSSTVMHVPIPPVVDINVGVHVTPVVGSGRSFSDVVKGGFVQHASPVPVQPLDKSTLITKMNNLRDTATRHCVQNSARKVLRAVSGKNIEELFSMKEEDGRKLLSPITVLKTGRKKLDDLQKGTLEMDIFDMLDKTSEESKKYHNEEMLTAIQGICNNELYICLLLLGGFMEQQIRVPLAESPLETAHILQTTEAPPAVGVWALFSLDMLDFQNMCASSKGKAMVVKVEKYIKGFLGKYQQVPPDPHSDFYAGKLQFLMQCLNETVSCNTDYISYSLETQLADLCSKRDIKPTTRVKKLVEKWDDYFKNNLLYHILQPFRPLVARWIIWCLNIYSLREELASHTTVGIVGLSNSGKSCLVKTLFRQKAAVGSTSMQRTTVSFLYNLEGKVDGLSVIDFPGIDDGDEGTLYSQELLRISQLIVFVLDYKRYATKAAKSCIEFFKKFGVPVLICLTHADKLYANTCIGDNGKEKYSKDHGRRFIQQELEKLREKLNPLPNWQIDFYSFCQDQDSSLNCDEGHQALSDVGILSCNDVGVWIEKELREYFKEEGIAERLKHFLASEKKKDEDSKPKQALIEATVVDDFATGLTKEVQSLNEEDDTYKAKSYTMPFEASEAIKLLRHAKFGFTKSFRYLLSELCIPTDMKQKLKEEAKYDGHDYEFPTEKAIDWWIANKEGSWEKFLDVLKNCEEVAAASYIEKRLV